MRRCNFTKEKTQTKNIVKLKPFELPVEDENEGLEGHRGSIGRDVVKYEHPPTTNSLTIIMIPFSDLLLVVFQNSCLKLPLTLRTAKVNQ